MVSLESSDSALLHNSRPWLPAKPPVCIWVSPGGISSAPVDHPSLWASSASLSFRFQSCAGKQFPLLLCETPSQRYLYPPSAWLHRARGPAGVWGEALFPLCHVLTEDNPRQTSEALVFCKWLFFSKVYPFVLFPMESWAQRCVLMPSATVDPEVCIFSGLD